MSKKKIIGLICIIILLITGIIYSIISFFTITFYDKNKIKTVVTDYIEQCVNMNFNESKYYLTEDTDVFDFCSNDDELSEEDKELYKNMMDMKFEIRKVNVKGIGKTADLEVVLNMNDFTGYYENKYFEIDNKKFNKEEKVVNLRLEKQHGKWKIDTTTVNENFYKTVTESLFTEKKGQEERLSIKITPDLEPKVIVKNYLDNVQVLNILEASKYTVGNTVNFKQIKQQINTKDTSIAHYNEFFKKMMNYNYEVSNVDINENTASVQIILKTYNFTTAIMDARLHVTDSQLASKFSGNSSDEDTKEKIAQEELAKILDPMERKLEIPVKLTLTKTEDGWRIDNDCIEKDLTYAIAGNVYNSISYYSEYYKDPFQYDGSISMASYDTFLKSKGIIYDENSKTSPFE